MRYDPYRDLLIRQSFEYLCKYSPNIHPTILSLLTRAIRNYGNKNVRNFSLGTLLQSQSSPYPT